MSSFNNRIIDARTHGRSRTYLVRTQAGNRPPEPITCFASYRINNRPLIDWRAPSSDETRRQIRLHFTYSRNNGPIQRVMIDENTEDWGAIDLLYRKLDSDLCRAQDGESLAFYLLSDGMGVMEQVIPDLNDIHLPPVLLPPIEATRMARSVVPEQPTYDYTITGISGDGLIPIEGVFNVDARKIAIPQPVSGLDLDGEVSSHPRWYPSNNIVKEDNTIVIYPSEGIEPYDFDLFRVLGGVGNVPITINSCVKAVPRKYICEASHVVGSQITHMMPARMALSRSDASVDGNREPVRFSDTPFPFKAAGRRGDTTSWPPSVHGELSTRGYDWIASYRRNDGPLKVITWNTGSREPGTQHSVWDAIKELLLDDYGRTAFMLSDFNSTTSSHNGDGDVTVKSGIGSNLNFTVKPREEGEPLSRSKQPYRYSGKSVEVRDRQIRFSDESAGAVWNENTITIYPTDYRVANEYGFDGHSDYYDYLCQYVDQQSVGDPIAVHSCAAVEPADHIQVNTKIILNSPEEKEEVEVPRMMGQGLSAAIKLNDGVVKHFKFEEHEVNVALNEILTYLYFMGKTPEITISQGDGTELKINYLYFRSNFTAHSSEISGCSGTERDQEFSMHVGNPIGYEDPNSTPRISILETPEPYKRESNKATFIKHPVNGYTDLFDLIKYTSGDEHTIYSSAVVPSVIWDKIDDGEGPGDGEPVDPEPVEGDLSGIEPFTFTNVSKPGTTGITKFNIGMSNTDGYWEIRESGQIIASPNHRADGVGFDANRDDYKSIVIYNMNGVTRDFEVYVRASTVSVGIESLYTKPGDVELKVTSFGNVSPKMIFRVGNGIVYLPETFPPHITDCEGMFNNGHNIGSDITGWDMSNVTNMAFMFADCRAFNQDISGWNVSNVTQMHSMFWSAYKFNQDLSKWCVTNITSYPNGFASEANAWTQPKPVWGTCPAPKPDLPDGTPLEFNIYSPSTNNPVVPLTFTIKAPESGWGLYENNILVCSRWTDGPGIHTINGNNGFITIQVDRNNLMDKTVNYKLFAKTDRVRVSRGYSNLTGTSPSIDVISFSDSCASQAFGFEWANLTVPTVLPPCITNAYAMFEECRKFNQDLSTWDTSNILYMNNMFATCSNFNGNVSTWDVSNVTNMESMFARATNFNQDLSGWNVVNIPTEPSNFAINAIQWVLPKPIWGTSGGTIVEPVGDTFEFTVVSEDTTDGAKPLVMNLGMGEDTWQLTSDGTVVATPTSTGEGITVENVYGDRVITISNLRARTANYVLTLKSSMLQLGDKNYTTAANNRAINITKFSNTVDLYKFNLDNTGLTVPNSIPTTLTTLGEMFAHCKTFNDPAVTYWNTENITNMAGTFDRCNAFNQPLNWSTRQVTTMNAMFRNCHVFDQDINNWNVGQVTDMESMFMGCRVFNQPLNNWNVSSVTKMTELFRDCKQFNKYIANWDVSKVNSFEFCFSSATAFNEDISIWKVKSARRMDYMFSGATSFNQNLSGWCVTGVDSKPPKFDDGALAWRKQRPIWGTCPPPPTHMPEYTPFEFNVTSSGGAGFALETSGNPTEWMLYQDDVLITTEETRSNHRVSDLKEGVTNFKLFTDGASINMREGSAGTNTTIDFLSFCEAVPRTNFSIQSYNFTVPKTLPANHTDLRDMFKGCNAFNQDLSEWDTSRVTDMSQMFYETSVFNGNITTWNTSQVTNFTRMFSSARVFNQDISNWDVSNALYMGGMFDIALVFNQPIGNWDISKVTSTQDMFKNAWEFNQDLSSWNVSNVQSMNGMFFVAKTFNQDLSGWNVAHIPDEPINFANLAAAWSEPKPVWGTDGKSSKVDFTDAFEFNVTSPLNGGFELSMSDVVGSYSIYVDNVLHSTGSETYPGKIFRDIPQGSVNYKIIANCAALKLMTTSGYTLTDLTVTSFGNNINIARFSLGNIKLTVPATLPSHMTNLSGMFSGSYKFNQDLSGWDVSRVTNMSSMFYQAKTFNGNISNWDMSNVTDMTLMLKSCELFNQDISGWNVSKCTKMTELFYSAEIFNQDISGWQVGSVSNMDRMFYAAKKFNQDLSGWNVGLISVEPSGFAPYTPVWVLPKPIWGTNGTPSDLPWSVTDTTVDQDVVDVNATKRINGVAYKSNIKYTPSNVAIKEAIANEDSTLLVTNVLNKLIGNVSNWTLDLNNNRIVYN